MRRGFTLLETVLVLAILVIAAAIAVPVIRSSIIDARMTAGADMIRARLADTRAHALDTGKPWKLAYMPGSGIFMLAAEDADEWNSAGQDIKETLEFVRGEMPKDIILAANRDDIAGVEGAAQASGGWQTLAVFTGDGSARDDGAVYIGKTGLLPYRIRVRALTGTTALDVPMLVKDQ
jgi:prepilin-type N-terminal cleavage/methylation domain-containing protein